MTEQFQDLKLNMKAFIVMKHRLKAAITMPEFCSALAPWTAAMVNACHVEWEPTTEWKGKKRREEKKKESGGEFYFCGGSFRRKKYQRRSWRQSLWLACSLNWYWWLFLCIRFQWVTQRFMLAACCQCASMKYESGAILILLEMQKWNPASPSTLTMDWMWYFAHVR